MNKIFSILALFIVLQSQASHLLGGQISVKYIGIDAVSSEKIFNVQVILYRDCLNGSADFDDPLILNVFELATDSLVKTENLYLVQKFYLNKFSAYPVCIEEGIYQKQIRVNKDVYFAYSRALRVDNMMNLMPEFGFTLFSEAKSLMPGTSTYVNNFLPFVLSPDTTDTIDLSMHDTYSDSTTYHLSTPLLGCSKFDPKCSATAKPYSPTPYNTGYSATNRFGSSNSVKLDSLTGILTLNFNSIGKYSIGVVVSKFKNGVLLYREICEQTIICSQGRVPLNINTREKDFSSVSLFPNPARNQIGLSVSPDNLVGQIKVILFNMNGSQIRECYVDNSKSINVSDLAVGVYFLQITDRNKLISRLRFIKI